MTLPVIDFSGFRGDGGDADRTIATRLRRACVAHGFFLLSGHGVDEPLRDAAFNAAKAFFDAPIEDKAAIAIEASPYHRGWYGEGGEILDARTQPQGDVKEGVKIGRDLPLSHPNVAAGMALHGPNQWPDAAAHPDFKPAMQACYAACEQVSRRLMQAFALSLELPPTHFDKWLSLPMATLSPLRYPPRRHNDGLGAGAHTDFGCLTLLMQHDEAGLEIAMPDGSWQGVPADRSLIVVNIGDMMARWTNDLYRSTRHRVVNHAGKTRHSLAFFFDPDADADLSPLPGCLADGQTPAYPPANALQHLLSKIEDSFTYRQEGG